MGDREVILSADATALSRNTMVIRAAQIRATLKWLDKQNKVLTDNLHSQTAQLVRMRGAVAGLEELLQ